ncbi:PAS domain S-box protein [Gloeothece citriformis]|uniref:PAS domain S-box protein n=1 Tax=Gloeothece citriformis TaxID=2546356 RepID=UPI0012FF27F3|nr:PAS domain S-box protein [Gloeothece citriformis]
MNNPSNHTIILFEVPHQDRVRYGSYLQQDERFPYQILGADSEQELLSLCSQNFPDLIILDSSVINNPIGEILNYLKECQDRENLPIVVISDDYNEEVGKRITSVKACNHLIKSQINGESLRLLIDYALKPVEPVNTELFPNHQFLQPKILAPPHPKTDEQTSQREQQFKTLADNAPDIIARFDLNFRHLYVNRAIEQATGLPASAFIGKTNRDLGMPEDLIIQWEATFKQVLATKQQTLIEFEFPTPDGIKSYQGRCVPEIGLDGSIESLLIVTRDITEQKRATEALKQREATLRSFFNTTPLMMGIVELIGEQISLVTCNCDNTDCWGICRKLMEQKCSDEPTEWYAALQSAHNSQSPVHFEYPYLTPKGKRWLSVTICWIADDLSKYPQFAFVAEDVTERKQSQLKIQEQAALIDIATDGIVLKDLDNYILFWSKGAERLYGWNKQEVLGKKEDELLLTLSNFYRDILDEIIFKGSWRGELTQITKEGKPILVESRSTLVRNESGYPQSILVVNTDITEKKQLEQQILQFQRLESLGTLASGIAHDLNNIFTPILAISQLIPHKFDNGDGKFDNQIQEWLAVLKSSAMRGSELVKQILYFVRGYEGQRSPLQVVHLLWEVVNIAKSSFPKSIEIVTALRAQNLWLINADSTQIHQVLMNLIINARDAMAEGGILTIEAENFLVDQSFARMNMEAHEGPYVVMTVTDTGVGIPPQLLERIFDPFFTTKEVGKGSGLGLATVLGIVRNHGGFIRLSSEVGKGTEFKVYFPAIIGQTSQLTLKEELLKGNGELILIVDDEATVREITKASLEKYNYKTLMASDGIDAIAIYAQYQHQISVIIMDLAMPNMDGLTCIRILQKMNPDVKVIATSGLSSNIELLSSVNLNTFLLKPYTLKELLKAVHKQISNTHKRC